MKPIGRFISALVVIDTFLVSYYIGLHSRSVNVVDPSLPPIKAAEPPKEIKEQPKKTEQKPAANAKAVAKTKAAAKTKAKAKATTPAAKKKTTNH